MSVISDCTPMILVAFGSQLASHWVTNILVKGSDSGSSLAKGSGLDSETSSGVLEAAYSI